MDKKNLAVTVKAVDETTRTIDFIISDESLDRDEDIILTSAWDFTEFQKNPQFLGFHNSQDYPLGIPVSWGTDARNRKTLMKVRFPRVEELATDPSTASEKAKLVDTTYNMYKIGMLSAVSVGFMTKEAERHKVPINGNLPRGRVISKCLLLEVSAVPIPSNSNAVAMVKSFSGDNFDTVSKAVFEDTKGDDDMELKELVEKVASLEAEIKALKEAKEVEPETKANRKLSKASMARIEKCTDHMGKAMEEIKGLVSDGVVEDEPEGSSDGVEKDKAPEVKKEINLATATVEEVNEYLRQSGGNTTKES